MSLEVTTRGYFKPNNKLFGWQKNFQTIQKTAKKLIFSAKKHACEMNDVILNSKKMKKIVKLFDTGGKNETKAIVTRFFLKIYDQCSRRLCP